MENTIFARWREDNFFIERKNRKKIMETELQLSADSAFSIPQRPRVNFNERIRFRGAIFPWNSLFSPSSLPQVLHT